MRIYWPFRLLVLLLSLLIVSGGVRAASPAEDAGKNSPIFQIEIPEAGIVTSALPVLFLESGEISQVKIYVLRPEADAIGYGDIYPSVNGAAAAVISETRASERGKRVGILLDRRPGFRLLPGFNTLEVRAVDQESHEFRATFVLHTPKGACEQGKAKLLTVDSLANLLRTGVSNLRLTTLVLDCGVDFQTTPSIEQRLRDLGAQEGLIHTIKDPLGAEQQGMNSTGFALGELLDLIQQRAPNDALVELVRSRGVNFELDDATTEKLRQAGATDQLLQVVRLVGSK
jgi:hypothetical protein